MPSDEYSSFGGGGALKLKGSKVKKRKKTKDKESSLEKALSTGESSSSRAAGRDRLATEEEEQERRKNDKAAATVDDNQIQRRSASRSEEKGDSEGDEPVTYKTESERRFAEARKKKLLEMSEAASGRPELLKTHKQRVEELNTYLSKLSEHHDMPKIGPG